MDVFYAFPSGTQSVLARAISAEIRAVLAARRMSRRELGSKIGLGNNYLALRLRDAKPLTLDDLELITHYLDEDVDEFVQRAWDTHSERLWVEQGDAIKKAEGEAQRRTEDDPEEVSVEPLQQESRASGKRGSRARRD
ncbi:MAG: helix-turn-helix transcriptional regulator [Nocardioides sp.]|uniref:hypothetical protein n=1 Tax=Nocardioides sp. TaxID=35761 RepID=UPI0039E356F5